MAAPSVQVLLRVTEPFRRLREGMVRFAVHTTAAHLERHVSRTLQRWVQDLHRRVPRYALFPELVDRWGPQTLALLIRVLRAEGEEEKRMLREEVHEHAHRVAAQQLRSGFSLEEILQAMGLLRTSVNAVGGVPPRRAVRPGPHPPGH